jgi:circadian clock protein KaiC
MKAKKNPAGTHEITLAKTGIPGLDEVLHGGLTAGAMYLVEGAAGTGKTTLGLQFALKGVKQGESVLYVTLSETQRDLKRVARSHGWNLEKVHVLEALTPPAKPASMFHPSEVQLEELMARLKDQIKQIGPARIVIDSLAEIRLMAETALRYRREIAGLRQELASCRCTILLLEETTPGHSLRTFVDGVILLEQLTPDYGSQRRRLWIVKVRGQEYAGGLHDFLIRRGGMEVFPRPMTPPPCEPYEPGNLPSGIASLDALLGGGITRGSSTLIVGAAGTGKSSLALQFAGHAAALGGHAALFLFDERPESALARASGLHMDVQPLVKEERLHLRQIDPAELSAGQFAHMIRQEVDVHGVDVVVIDSLNGYLQAMPDQRFLLAQMHKMLVYLDRCGVTTFLVMGQAGTLGDTYSPANASYLTDNILLLRFFETAGEVRKAISVVKKRGGAHETAIRELKFGPDGITVGEALRQFQGILSGEPTFTGAAGRLRQVQDDESRGTSER